MQINCLDCLLFKHSVVNRDKMKSINNSAISFLFFFIICIAIAKTKPLNQLNRSGITSSGNSNPAAGIQWNCHSITSCKHICLKRSAISVNNCGCNCRTVRNKNRFLAV